MKGNVQLVLPLLFLELGFILNCPAQDITVRLVDVRNGHVFVNKIVNVRFDPPEGRAQSLRVTTGADGTAKVHLPEPTPESIIAFVAHKDTGLVGCSSVAPINTQQIIREGVLRCAKPSEAAARRAEGCGCKFTKQVAQLKETPGELVLLAKPITWLNRMEGSLWGW